MGNKTTEILEEIWRGEKSASETYTQALEKIGPESGAGELLRMKQDHIEAMQDIGRHLHIRNQGTPDGSGTWGVWAKTVMGSAKVFGDIAALKALKEGEEHGLRQYRDVVNEDIDPQLRNLIKDTLIPRQEMHIRSLDRLMTRINM